MRIDNSIINKEDLSDFSLSVLSVLRQRTEFIKTQLDEQLNLALELELVSESMTINRQLFFISFNLSVINSVFSIKQSKISVNSRVGEYFLN